MSCRNLFLLLLVGVLTVAVVHAQEFSSTNYTVSNPVLQPGGYSSSASFGLTSVVSQLAIGTSTSATFQNFAGFLYFPFVSSPVLSATPGNGQVSLSWTVPETALGLNVDGYSFGQAVVSGGPYSYTAVGNVTSAIVSPLTNGTPYYFIVRANDTFGNVIATSSEVTATPAAGNTGGGGGGGGGYGGSAVTGVQLSGSAYPSSKVTVLKDGQIAATTIAGPDAHFQITLSGLSAGSYVFAVYAEDHNGIRSTLFTFPTTITTGALTTISGIFIAPTIDVDKSEVKRGDNITIFGQSTPSSQITISVHSNQEYFSQVPTDAAGAYLKRFDSSPLEYGSHVTKSKTVTAVTVSPFGQLVSFTVGTQNIPKAPATTVHKADLNGDGRVNLTDFSIAAYWYHRTSSTTFTTIERDRLNGDGKIDLVDFSIMAYYWTG